MKTLASHSTVVLLASFLAVNNASAISSFEGEATSRSSASLDGVSNWLAEDVAIASRVRQEGVVEAPMKMNGSATRFTVHRYQTFAYTVNTPTRPFHGIMGQPDHSFANYSAGSFSYASRAPFAAAIVWAEQATLDSRGSSVSILDAIQTPHLIALDNEQGAQANPQEKGGSWWLTGNYLSFKHQGVVGKSSGHQLFYWSLGTVKLRTAEGELVLESKVWDDPSIPGVANKTNIVWHVLESWATDARFEVPPAGRGLQSLSFSKRIEAVDIGAISLDSVDSLGGSLPESSKRTGPALWVQGPLNVTLAALSSASEARDPSYAVTMTGDPKAYSLGGGPAVSILSVSMVGITGASIFGLAAIAVLLKFVSILYTRIEPAHLSGHPVRKSILERLEEGAALRAPELVALTGHASWAVRHHLGLLQRTGSVIAVGSAWQKRYKLASAPAIAHDPTNSPVADHVVASLNGHPVRFIDVVRDVQSRTGVSKMGVWKAIQRLEGEGRIQRHRKGRKVWVASPGVVIA